ncbi:MAG: MFS transporter, partial [Porticoccaceae bacterium]|nr:MFS transporter [Porticoccaceae bacterium]
MLGLFMVLPVLASSVEGLDDYSPLMLGLVIGAYGLTQAILQIPLGLLSDRLGRQTIILFGLTVFVIGSIVAAFADSMLDLLIGRALQGMGAIASTLMALVTDLTIEDNRSKAMAIIGGSIGFAFILAMMVGPIVTLYLGLSGVFWMTALLGLLGICITIFFMPKISNPARNREADADIQQISALLRDRTLTRLNTGIFALHFALMAAFLVIPSILGKELSINTGDLPLAYLGLLGGGFFLMLPAMIWAEKHSKQKLVLLVAISVMAGATFILGIQRTIVLTPVLLLVFFAAFNLLEAALPSWLSKSCPVGNRGTAMGIYSTSQFLGSFFGGLIGGWTLQYLGVDALFYLVGSII